MKAGLSINAQRQRPLAKRFANHVVKFGVMLPEVKKS